MISGCRNPLCRVHGMHRLPIGSSSLVCPICRSETNRSTGPNYAASTLAESHHRPYVHRTIRNLGQRQSCCRCRQQARVPSRHRHDAQAGRCSFSKKRKHYLSIGFMGQDGKAQGVVFELGKRSTRAALKTLEVRSGQKHRKNQRRSPAAGLQRAVNQAERKRILRHAERDGINVPRANAKASQCTARASRRSTR